MDIDKFKSPKHALHPFLFCLGATLSMCFFIFLIIITSFVLWLMMPSVLVYGFSATVFMALFSFIFLLARRRKRPGLMAVSLGAMSAPALLLALALIGALFRTKLDQPANRQQPSTSPSGKYVLTVPIERARRSGLLRFGHPYWHITISDPNGKVLYRDPQEQFPGWLGAYWIWDDQDRVWIFSYDSGTVFFECSDGVWTRHEWSSKDEGHRQRGVSPPGSLCPKRTDKHQSDRPDASALLGHVLDAEAKLLCSAQPTMTAHPVGCAPHTDPSFRWGKPHPDMERPLSNVFFLFLFHYIFGA